MMLDLCILILLSLCAVYLIAMPIAGWIYSRILIPRRIRRIGKAPEFPVNVIVPCHGATDHLEENLRATMNQDYPDYTVSFVTDTADDPAVKAISSIVRENRNARHIVAGFSDKTYGKNYAQIVAIAQDKKSDVFVICDSDLRPERDFVRRMVEPFMDPRVYSTTSSRWITPSRLGIAQCMYTALEGCRPMLLSLPYPLIWGGCFGISRKAYDELEIENAWSNTEDDDLVLSTILRKRRKGLMFCPGAVSYSHEAHTSVKKLAKWWTYQGFTGRLHEFPSWFGLLMIETIVSIGMVGSVALIAAQAVNGGLDYRALTGPVLAAMIAANTILLKLPYRKRRDMPWLMWVLVPFPAHFVIAFATWRSALQRKMYRGPVTLEFNRDGTIRKYIRNDTKTTKA